MRGSITGFTPYAFTPLRPTCGWVIVRLLNTPRLSDGPRVTPPIGAGPSSHTHGAHARIRLGNVASRPRLTHARGAPIRQIFLIGHRLSPTHARGTLEHSGKFTGMLAFPDTRTGHALSGKLSRMPERTDVCAHGARPYSPATRPLRQSLTGATSNRSTIRARSRAESRPLSLIHI